MYKHWSALDMALILELSLQKEGDRKANVLQSLHSLSALPFRALDKTLPAAINQLAGSPDPVTITQMVVDNYFRISTDMEVEQFEAAPEEPLAAMVEEARNMIVENAVKSINNFSNSHAPSEEEEETAEDHIARLKANAQQTLIDSNYEDSQLVIHKPHVILGGNR